VLLLNAADRVALELLLERYGMQLELVASGEAIPGSYWGHSEAGLRGERLYARLDTPVHSVLHEASHYICMTAERRAGLDRDAGGTDLEESAVCYGRLGLQLPPRQHACLVRGRCRRCARVAAAARARGRRGSPDRGAALIESDNRPPARWLSNHLTIGAAH
jgi:hypothetical protein